MGDTFGDGQEDEKPVQSVRLRDFFIGRYEVTFDEFDAFCQETGRAKPNDSGWGRGNLPVIAVNWFDAVEYCNWRSLKEGKKACYRIDGGQVSCDFSADGYRLPTEAEWEYAAKGGNSGENFRYSGSDDAAAVACHNAFTTLPVGQLKPNGLKLFDMSGNVWEWCWDWYGADTYAKSTGDNPTGPLSGTDRILRGGSWRYDQRYCRTSDRIHNDPSYLSDSFGFRIVRSSK